MKIILSSRRHPYLARIGIFLIMVVLIAGMVGCVGVVKYDLVISSTTGGSVTTPGEGTFTYDEGTVVNLLATPSGGYWFVSWTGDVDNIADVNAASTTIAMSGDYSITAKFEKLFAGGIGTEEDPYQIADWHHLNNIRYSGAYYGLLSAHYSLMNNLDSTAAGYEEWASETANGGKGWQPIGTMGWIYWFTGTFDGQGYEIRDLFINRPDETDVGLFGVVADPGTVENIGVVDINVNGDHCVGGLVGVNAGTVRDSYSTGSVSGGEDVGGLVGFIANGSDCPGTVSNSYSTCSVIGDEDVGGLVGWNGGTVSNSYSTGSVSGGFYVGGLVGNNEYGTVNNSYSTGSVSGDNEVGGLVGWNHATVSNSYATGNVAASNWYAGGLVGASQGTVSNSYSTGSVTGDEAVGGLVGANWGTVSNSYSTGNVSGYEYVGGLVGANTDTVSNSFWDIQTSGQATSAGGTGKTTAQMKDIDTFSGAGWDIIAVDNSNDRNTGYVWNIVDDETYPFLSWQPV